MEPMIKNLTLKVADIDGKKRMVKFYYAAWDNVDGDGDIIRKGATLKTTKERGPKGKGIIRHFVNHEFRANPAALPVGMLTEMGEDSKGAWAWSKMARTSQGSDIYNLYEDGYINNHSFGFDSIPGKYKQTNTGIEFYEVKIYEVSTVTTLGANENTPTLEVKEDKGAEIITPSIYESLFVEPQTIALKTKADLTELSKLIDYSLFKI